MNETEHKKLIPVRISLMKADDIPAVARIEKETFSLPWSAQGFADALSQADTLFLVAHVDEAETISAETHKAGISEIGINETEFAETEIPKAGITGTEISETGNVETVGYCGYYRSFEEAEIVNVAVREDMRGNGIGEKMIAELVRIGREAGVVRFLLEVRKSNESAIRCYEKNGFAVIGMRRNFYEKPMEDAAIMLLDVSKESAQSGSGNAGNTFENETGRDD